MKILCIFDHPMHEQSIRQILPDYPVDVDLFALTSNALILQDVQKTLAAINVLRLNQLNSAILINDAVTRMQKTIHAWSSALGRYRIGKKTLKEWFLLPDQGVSAWWFSALSEKNTVQEDTFFKIAQVNAIHAVLDDQHYDLCLISLADKRQCNILMKLAKKQAVRVHLIRALTAYPVKKLKMKILAVFKAMGACGALCMAGIHGLQWLRHGRLARRLLPPFNNRKLPNNPLLFVSYFPHVDASAAEQGIFCNKYGLALQEKLKQCNIPITWLLMPVTYNGYDFKASLQLAKKFSAYGETLFVLQEFFTVKIFIKSCFWWLKQAMTSGILAFFIDKKIFTAELTHPESLPLVKYLWWHSFIGAASVRGIIFYLTYQEMFKHIPHIKQCLYYCEMQAWEKGLNAAKKSIQPLTQTLAFQHATVMRNFYNYFYDAEEILPSGKNTDFPAPDLLIANGQAMHTLLAESCYPQLTQAEAVRQLYINHFLNKPMSKKRDKPLVLVAGSFDRQETKSLISMVYAAFPVAETFDIWIKGFPATPVEDIFTELNIDVKATGYKISHQDIAELLAFAAVAVVPSSTVAIEAILFECQVIIPLFADTMLLNPLIDVSLDYSLISTAAELKNAIENALLVKPVEDISSATRSFMKNYWNLDQTLSLWEKIF